MLPRAARLTLLCFLPAMVLQQLGWRLVVAPRQDSLPIFAVVVPWLPLLAIAAVHGFRATRVRELFGLAVAGTPILMAIDLVQGFTVGTDAERGVVLESPARWAAVSVVLWSAMLLLFQLAPFAGRRAVQRILGRR